jgi:hypothetical protein
VLFFKAALIQVSDYRLLGASGSFGHCVFCTDLRILISPLVSSIKEIMIATINSGISNQLRDIYSTCRFCWNVATYKLKIHNEKIEIISFVVQIRPIQPSLSMARSMSRYEADISASVISFISSSIG